MTVTLTATNEGFHWVSGIGTEIAPDLLLSAIRNTEGWARLDQPGNTWQAASAGGTVTLKSDQALNSDLTFPATTDARFEGLTFFRGDGGNSVRIGSVQFEQPLEVEAYFETSYNGTAPAWHAPFDAALFELVQHQGLRFEGAAGRDVVDLTDASLPIHGAVVLIGRGGDDILSTGRMDSYAHGGAGDDILTDAGGSSRLAGGRGDDSLSLGVWSTGSVARGGQGDDHLTSSNGADRLIGGGGNDQLSGGRGADKLSGGRGTDQLTGGEGADTFIFRAGHSGIDTVTDFELDVDTLSLRGTRDEIYTQQGNDLLVTWNEGDSGVLLAGVMLEDWA